MKNLEVWIPVILALIAFINGMLNRLDKIKARKDAANKGDALKVAVDAIEESGNQQAKETVELNTREMPELQALIKEFKEAAEARRKQ